MPTHKLGQPEKLMVTLDVPVTMGSPPLEPGTRVAVNVVVPLSSANEV